MRAIRGEFRANEDRVGRREGLVEIGEKSHIGQRLVEVALGALAKVAPDAPS